MAFTRYPRVPSADAEQARQRGAPAQPVPMNVNLVCDAREPLCFSP
jgi:hypothetical protein